MIFKSLPLITVTVILLTRSVSYTSGSSAFKAARIFARITRAPHAGYAGFLAHNSLCFLLEPRAFSTG
jgi:hypothetical protein